MPTDGGFAEKKGVEMPPQRGLCYPMEKMYLLVASTYVVCTQLQRAIVAVIRRVTRDRYYVTSESFLISRFLDLLTS